jgi:hypothetical protein
VYLPSERFLSVADAGDDFRDQGKVTLLDCDCGNSGCWPLGVRIQRIADRVVWSEFENAYRPWDYSRFGPFEFELKGYLEALRSSHAE